ncbi:MAG: hypothetical protein H6613_12035 [Ignavibacteriales bacterium]|nr:hypothetical protein [Ignavibacteriales bacterium]
MEIGIVRIENGKITETFQSLLNPEQFIPPFISQLTGITNAEVFDAPTFESISQDVKEFIEGSILIGHNLPFDYAFLKSEFERADIQLPKLEQICTLKFPERFS